MTPPALPPFLRFILGGLFFGALFAPLSNAADAPKAELLPEKNSSLPPVEMQSIPAGKVLAEVFEHAQTTGGAPADWEAKNDKNRFQGFTASWDYLPTNRTQAWVQSDFAIAHLPPKYNARGLRDDRSVPFVVRLSAKMTLPRGSHEVLLRAIKGSRLLVDGGALLASNIKFQVLGKAVAADAEPVPDQLEVQLVKSMALLKPGHSEAISRLESDNSEHLMSFEFFVGGKDLRPEPGSPVVSIRSADGIWRVLRPGLSGAAFTNEAWTELVSAQRDLHESADHLQLSPPTETAFWNNRHTSARKLVLSTPPKHAVPSDIPSDSMIDALLLKKRAGASVAPLVSDAAFLRRASLDITGLPPAPSDVEAFLADKTRSKRATAIERLLQGNGWAHQWVPYWQDVLAENPAILKATLNNTGPFRWFLYDALRDNWSADRFATALIRMEGSSRHGGAAGFATASQNDLPMAQKAQILGSAFLSMEMKCARCHDAPSHPVEQAELFALSAMLQRSPVEVPESSLTKGLKPGSHVTVTLKAGQKIAPEFPFSNFQKQPLPGFVQDPGDSRENLAAIITDPRNPRFAEVLVNRIWKRLMGWTFIEPVDDWDSQHASHPELLEWLARELVGMDYDLKKLVRLIMVSDAYQRETDVTATRHVTPEERSFAAPARRRLSAEQLLDSLFFIAGKRFESEPLNFDLDGRRSAKDFLNLGEPYRAWHLVGLSNERDRPSLAKPFAQALTDVLRVNGWRESRAEPKTAREDGANPLQPAIFANGDVARRITQLSDDSAFTRLALEANSPEQFLEGLFLRILNRKPSHAEREAVVAYIKEEFPARVLPCSQEQMPRKARFTKAVMWSNHLHPDSTKAIYEAEALLKAGDPPTKRLTTAWRQSAEDVVWALLLTPEFAFLP